MVVTLGQGWGGRRRRDPEAVGIVRDPFGGPTTVIKIGLSFKRCGNRPTRSDHVLPIVGAAGSLLRKLWEGKGKTAVRGVGFCRLFHW